MSGEEPALSSLLTFGRVEFGLSLLSPVVVVVVVVVPAAAELTTRETTTTSCQKRGLHSTRLDHRFITNNM